MIDVIVIGAGQAGLEVGYQPFNGATESIINK
jgi:ribulose 1,5-bisphosphate synthetase/thiazole synthase